MKNYQAEVAFFDSVAEAVELQHLGFDRYDNPQNPSLYIKKMMFHLLHGKSGLDILEIGCGDGVTSLQLAHCGHHVTGVDISPKAIDLARKRAVFEGLQADFLTMNVMEENFPAGRSFDVVWCEMVLHHMLHDLGGLMGKLKGILRPGGMFIASEPVSLSPMLKKIRPLFPA